jgi:hypothetical protein
MTGYCRRHRDHLRCMLDAQSHANTEDVHQLLRRRLRGKGSYF